MGLAIDWVSVVILGVAYGITMIKAVNERARNLVWALAMFVVAGWRFSMGPHGVNLVFAVLAIAMGLNSLRLAVRSPP